MMRGTMPVFCAALLLGSAAWAGERAWDGAALWRDAVTCNVSLDSEAGGIALARGTLYEDDGPAAGYTYEPSVEVLGDGVCIKKRLVIGNPQAREATLLVAPGGEIEVEINGRPAKLGEARKVGNYWRSYTFDPGLLEPGHNEFVVRGEGKVWIARDEHYRAGSTTRTEHPNRSFKSTDGGKTWRDRQLGKGDDLDGEYYLRVFLESHRPSGRVRLPVVDAGNPANAPIAPPAKAPAAVEVRLQADAGGEELTLRGRSGSTYAPGGDTWSDWQTLKVSDGRARIERPRGRFVQLEALLATSDGERTPVLREVAVASEPEMGEDWTSGVKIVESDNPPIVRTAIPFAYERFDHPKLVRLRKEYRLDEIVAGAKSELEEFSRLAAWSATRWEKLGHLGQGYPPWDALEILKPHADGTPVGGFCQQFNLVFLQACQSLGHTARVVSIGPGNHTDKIRGGHETVEVWSNEYGKWMYFDGNTAWYAIDKETRIPLSLVELRDRQLDAFAGRRPRPIEVVKLAETRYEWPNLESWPPLVELRMVPRNNFLSEASPLPLNQGMRGWFWTGHYVWTDERLPARKLYSNRVAKRANFEWTLNRAHVHLAATDEPGRVQVHLDSVTPGFETYLAAVDGEDFQPVEAPFAWKLHAGRNVLSVKSRNRAGVAGSPSRIAVEYRAP